jgi:UDP-GlcNAc:undecaprenyl-phosphate GlcNAc-1-phosphate transferase
VVDAAWAVPVATASIAVAFWWNRRVRGFLPDDPPRPGRKQHAHAVPLGGVALLPPLLGWLLGAGRWCEAGATLAVAAVGFVDDWQKELGRDFDWRIKLVVQWLSAAAVAIAAVDPLAQPVLCCAALVLVFVLTNAVNFLDNTDGVAAMLAGVGLVAATGGHGALAAAGFAALAFVPWNWPRPLLFLGDSGAYALGLCCGATVVGRLDAAPGAALLPFAVPLADFAQVVAARVALGLRPWVGDRRHLTHVAQNLGLPRVACAPLFAAAAATIALAWR